MTPEIIDVTNNDIDDMFIPETIAMEPPFGKIKKKQTGFYIWRIEDTDHVSLMKYAYGIFYDQECYLILAVSLKNQRSGVNAIVKDTREPLEYHVHFWIGQAARAEKIKVAAYKCQDLDLHLGGITTQHREVQGKESARFKSYFPTCIKIFCGESESLMKIEDQYYEPRMYCITGVRAPIITQLPDISWNLFNSNNVFLLHTTGIIFIWIGRAANSLEKYLATVAAKYINTELKVACTIEFVDDGYEKTLPDIVKKHFESLLPLDQRSLISMDTQVEENNENEKKERAVIKLYHCIDQKGKYRVTEIKNGPLNQNDLDSESVHIIDHTDSGIWIWVGKGVNGKDRTDALKNARGFVKKKKYNNRTPVTRVVQGFEPREFRLLFTSWNAADLKSSNKCTTTKVTKFDVETMDERPALAAKSQLIDDGFGTLKVWRIKRKDVIEIPKERFGIFFTDDCYVVFYTYKNSIGEDRYVIYYWMGNHSIPDEQDTMLEHVEYLDETFAQSCGVLVRVSQGKEPPHFLQLFKGRMRLFNGKGTDYDTSGKNIKTPNTCMLQIQGTSTYNTKALQVQQQASSLDSNLCFVVKRFNSYFIWCGAFSNGDNREMAKLFVGSDFDLLLEGSESKEFWMLLGGKTGYKAFKTHEKYNRNEKQARLFKCFTSTNKFVAEEILYFEQKDIFPSEVILLDCQCAIYLWIGNRCYLNEEKNHIEIAKEYLRQDPHGRDAKTTIVRVKQLFEPPTFIGFFDAWNKDQWANFASYEEVRQEIEQNNPYLRTRISNISKSKDFQFDSFNKYNIQALKAPVESLPSLVNPQHKELHLTYDDFMALFQMEYKEFEKLPLWKRQEMKKAVGLF